MAPLSFIVTYRRPRSTFNRVFNERRRSISTRRPDHKPNELLTWDNLPDWHKDNHFIQGQYRPIYQSAKACLASITHLHNETVNIWTHLLPAGGFVAGQGIVQLLIDHYYPEAHPLDRIVFGTNLACAIITMTLSSLYHTLMCHSEHVSNLWLRIDYVGILTLILGSFLSGIYVGKS
jgi:adiponectin receptor